MSTVYKDFVRSKTARLANQKAGFAVELAIHVLTRLSRLLRILKVLFFY